MKMSSLVLLALLFFAATGCGVRGDPVPPDRPVEIGRGKPSFRRATEKIKVKAKQSEEDLNGKKKNTDQDEESE